MSRRSKLYVSEAQLGLALTGEGFDGPAKTNGLLSLAYLLRHLKPSDALASMSDVTAAYDRFCSLYRKHASALRTQNEAFTCSTFLEPLLDTLGWHRIPQQSMPGSMVTRKRPDYCLVTSEAAFAAASRADAVALFQLSATVLEAKRWGHPLDRLSAQETPGWFPSQQIQDYLNHAKDATGRRFFDWAILTNGCEWRLYSEQSAVGAHFSFHLVREGQLCSLDDFRLFFTLFRARAFERTSRGTCFLDEVREQSRRVQADLESNLRKRIFGYLEDLYVHFTDLGFARLRAGGGFGFIVSDTFFTLASKQRMRDLLQTHALEWLGQCDPFDATVDAAIFVARKQTPGPDHRCRFVQARPLKRSDGTRTKPEENLDKLLEDNGFVWNEPATPTAAGEVRHAIEAELRVGDGGEAARFCRDGARRRVGGAGARARRGVAACWAGLFAAQRAGVSADRSRRLPGDHRKGRQLGG